jgi:hypothetical protein
MSHPAISVNIAIEPASVTLGEPDSIILSTTLSHPTPITIYTWPTVFNLHLSQRRRNFFCIGLSNNNEPVRLETTKGGKRSGHISRVLGGVHDQYFVTLEPGKTVEIRFPFFLTTRLDNTSRQDGPLIAGHRYRFGFNEGESVWTWFEGTREEVLAPPGEESPIEEGKSKILLDTGPPIEFEVLES